MIKRYNLEYISKTDESIMVLSDNGDFVKYNDIKHLIEPKKSLQDSMKEHLEKFKNLPDEVKKTQAKQFLVAMGYLNEDGTVSDNYGKNFGQGNGKN
jgi:hypothetical protein